MPEFLNIELMNWEDFFDLVIRTVFNLGVVLYLVRYLYYQFNSHGRTICSPIF